MKYEKPEVVELSPAINAVQSHKAQIDGEGGLDPSAAYQDWEE